MLYSQATTFKLVEKTFAKPLNFTIYKLSRIQFL